MAFCERIVMRMESRFDAMKNQPHKGVIPSSVATLLVGTGTTKFNSSTAANYIIILFFVIHTTK